MRAEHIAIDGSTISIEAGVDLTSQTTATGWAIVPALSQSHPFAVYPAGHSRIVEEVASSSLRGITIVSREEFSLKGRTLRVAEVQVPRSTGGMRDLTVAAWEGSTGCLTTSMPGHRTKQLVEVFDTLAFSESARGLAIDSPVVPRPRPPELIKEIPELGIVNIRPAVYSELELVPRARGFATKHGELFRRSEGGPALMLVGRSAIARIDPIGDVEPERLIAAAQDLRIEWAPRKYASAHAQAGR